LKETQFKCFAGRMVIIAQGIHLPGNIHVRTSVELWTRNISLNTFQIQIEYIWMIWIALQSFLKCMKMVMAKIIVADFIKIRICNICHCGKDRMISVFVGKLFEYSK